MYNVQISSLFITSNRNQEIKSLLTIDSSRQYMHTVTVTACADL